MGAWGHEVLANDTALDLMWELKKSSNVKAAVERIFSGTDYLDELLLAIEIVDISLNGVDESILGNLYDYGSWMRELVENPMTDLREQALEELEYIKENDFNWVPSCIQPRKELLEKIEKRLKEEK